MFNERSALSWLIECGVRYAIRTEVRFLKFLFLIMLAAQLWSWYFG